MKCCFVTKTWGEPDPVTRLRTPPEYCGKQTRYTMVRDDDHNLVRKYDHFCPEHRAWVDANPDPDDLDA